MLYHLGMPWLPSGHMGVVLFLVLGGYLASSTALRAMRRGSMSSVPILWLKRVLRIWPAMAAMVACVVALCAGLDAILLTKLRPDLVPSLLLANNLGAILRGASYFDNLGGTSPLMHLWYLGVDMQFFVVWTLLASFLCPGGRSNRVARRAALALAVVSAVLMAVLFDPNADPTRVYYGPDTRAFAPLLGAWLGLAWPLGGRPVRLDYARHTVRSVPLQIAGPLGLAGLAAIMVLSPATAPFLYRGGMMLGALCCVAIVAAALDRGTLVSRVFSARPLVWLGARSYGLYLWHFPLFQLFKVNNATTSPAMVVLSVALSFVATEVSLRLIERPVAAGRLPLVLDLGRSSGRRGSSPDVLGMVPVGAMALVVAAGITGLLVVPPQTAVPEGALQSTGASASEAVDLTKVDRTATKDEGASDTDASAKDEDSSKESGTDKDADKSDDSTKTSKNNDSSGKSSSKKSSSSKDSGGLPTGSIYLQASAKSIEDGLYTPLMVADSVAGDCAWCFAEHMPDAWLDSYLGRRPDQALEVLKGYIKQGVVGDIVIIASFSNIPTTDDVMDALVEACGDREVFLVNARILANERVQINKGIDDCAKRHDNVHVIDWFSVSNEHDDWFYADGEHLTPEGQPVYVDTITNAIAEEFAKAGGTVLGEDDADEVITGRGGQDVVDHY